MTDELVARLRERYTSPEVPPCPVCGGELSIQAIGRGPTVWACAKPEGVSYGAHSEHYQLSRHEQYRHGDSDVLELLDLFVELHARVGRETA